MDRPSDFGFIAGHLALDFVNTLDWRDDPARRRDLLGTFDDLLEWAAAASVTSAAELRKGRATARLEVRAGARTLRRARRLRELLARLLVAKGKDDRAPSPADLRLFNAFLGSALRRRRVATQGEACVWGWTAGVGDTLDALLWPITLASAELLTSPDLPRIRVCAGDGCGWLFLDASRSGRRRWCDMQGCGNRAKARRFYQRAREAE